jgi:uncharacterized membrane protein
MQLCTSTLAAWFPKSWLSMAATSWVVLVLYWCEFSSQTLERIQQPR